MLSVSERRACRVLGQHRSTQRKAPRGRDDEEALTADIIALAREYGRYGYRKITALLRAAGWVVNAKRVERIWRREGLKVPAKQPKKGRLWLNDGSCVRLRPEHPNHVWSYDFVEDRTHDGRKFRMLNVIDEFTHECLTIRLARKLKATDVIDVRSDLFILRGVPSHIRSDGAPASVRTKLQELESNKARLEAELASLSAALPQVEIHPNVPELYRCKVSVLAKLLTDEDTRPEAMEIIRSLIERIEVGPPEAERGPCTVPLLGGLASVLAFVSEQEGNTELGGRAARAGQGARRHDTMQKSRPLWGGFSAIRAGCGCPTPPRVDGGWNSVTLHP